MIAKSWFGRDWQWKIGSCVALVGTLSIGLSENVLAQIVPDKTLGAEGSVVTPNVNIQGIPSDRIDGGAIRGANLFHSFEQLNVGAGRGVYFANPAGIENILSRVTGANRSDILGRLGVLGNANLFLINPKGIVFGLSSSLDVQGSFLATTADAVKLGDAGLFSASQPTTSNLLTVSPSAFWFNAIAAQPIVNQSQAQSPIGQPNLGGLSPGLQVQPGRTLALVGGNVLLEGGRLTAAAGRIELGSMAGVGQVSLTESGNRFVLGYDSINDFGNISLSNGAFVDASGEGGGDVQIRGARLEITQSSNIWANTFGAQNGKEVLVRTSEVVLSETSLLSVDVIGTGTGTGGNLTIDTGRLLVRDGAQVSASTRGSGKGGSLQITASESVEVIGESADGQFPSGLFSASAGTGDAGDLRIDTGRLLMSDGAQVSAGTRGSGKGGSLQITASESVEVIGESANGQNSSSLFSDSDGKGDAGDLKIDTGRLLVRDGARVSASATGSGKGGSLQITASELVEVIGESADGQFPSGLFAQSERTASGDAGDLTIDTGRLLVRDGSQVSAGTRGLGKGGSLQITASESVEVIGESANGQFPSGLFSDSYGRGDAGDLRIDTDRLLVSDGAQVSAGTRGSGKGGSLQITASESVEVIGESADGQGLSGLFSDSYGRGDAGDLKIDTGRLLVRDGAQVSASTFGLGKGGSLQITASELVEVIGESAYGQGFSGLFVQSERTTSGDAGDLRIDTRRLLLRDGARVSASTIGSGKGGSLQITASELVEVIGESADNVQDSSSLSALSLGSGDAGDLRIDTRRLLLRDGSQVSAGTRGSGKGGSLQITASESVEVIGNSANGQRPSGLFAPSVGSGDAGDLTIDTGRLLLRDGAQVSTRTFGSGKGGSLQITASESVEVIGNSANGQNSSGLLTQSGGSGDAGDLRIDTRRLLLRDGAQVSTSTTGLGKGGNLQITASESVEVIGNSANGQNSGGLFTDSGGRGDAGDLTIDTDRLLLRDGARVSAGTSGSGKGGSLQITASESVEVIGNSANGQNSSGLVTESQGSGDAGDLTIDTERLLVRDGAVVSAGTSGSGKGGSLQITASESVEVIGESAYGQFPSGLFTTIVGSGDAGDLTIDTGRLLVRDGAVISSGSFGDGTAGDINITVRDTLQADNGTIRTDATQSSGGGITITASDIRLFSDSDIRTNVASGAGGGGNIKLTANSIIAFGDSDILAYADRNDGGKGGNITLDTRAFFGENYSPASSRNDPPNTLDGNNRVDVNATGAVGGVITIPDVSFIQNSLTELPENQINTDSLLANSCIVRRNQPSRGSFIIAGTGGLPQRPGDAQMSSFPTVDVETLPSDSTPLTTNSNRPWQKGDPIVEPQGVYRLSNGKLVMSRECS